MFHEALTHGFIHFSHELNESSNPFSFSSFNPRKFDTCLTVSEYGGRRIILQKYDSSYVKILNMI